VYVYIISSEIIHSTKRKTIGKKTIENNANTGTEAHYRLTCLIENDIFNAETNMCKISSKWSEDYSRSTTAPTPK